ncbi:hypothetical protein WA158_005249 [Blastocystis sp. Blastoise]
MEPESKRRKTDDEDEQKVASTVIVQFVSADGKLSDKIDLPMDYDPSSLEDVLNQLLGTEEEPTPYAFYVGNTEVTENLEGAIKDEKLSTETSISICYVPLSIFRVNPVTRCSNNIPGHTEAILHVQFSPDGQVLGTGGGDKTVRFWDINTCTPITTCVGHKNHVLCTAWSPNGHYYASGDKSGIVMIWDPQTGKLIQTLRGHRLYITSLCWEPLHLNKSCERVASSSKDGTVIVWNVRTGLKELTISGHSDSIECVKWSGEGMIYTAGRDRIIRVWNMDIHQKKNNGKLIRTLIGHGHRINSLSLSNEYTLRSGGFDFEHQSFKNEEDMYKNACEKYAKKKLEGEEKLVSCSDDFTMFVWTPLTSKTPLFRLVGHQQLVNHIAFSPDSRYIASASFDKKVKIWDAITGKIVSTLSGHVGAVYQVAWSPDSRYVASASKDSTIKIWKVKEKKAMYTLSGHADEVYALDWNPFGICVASGGKDRVVKIWKN